MMKLFKFSAGIVTSVLLLHNKLHECSACMYIRIVGFERVCHIFRYFISNLKSLEFQEHQYAMLKKMSKFLNQTTCRRAAILSHFTSKFDKTSPRKDCCDNCTDK